MTRPAHVRRLPPWRRSRSSSPVRKPRSHRTIARGWSTQTSKQRVRLKIHGVQTENSFDSSWSHEAVVESSLSPPPAHVVDSLTMPVLRDAIPISNTSVRLFFAHTLGISLALILISCSETRPTPAEKDSEGQPTTLTIGFPYPSGQDALHGVAQAARLASLEGLTTQNLSGRPVPRLAESWSQSADGLTWTIQLRRTAVFHDGSPVDSTAVKNSLDRFLRTREGRFNPGLQHISSITASPHEVSIHLSQRSTLLLDDLETPITKVDANGTIVGTGPYVVSGTSENEVEMTAFPRYYRGVSAISRIVWRVYPTVRTAWAAAMRGEADFLYEVGPESREFLESEGSVTLYPFLRNYVYALVFNVDRPEFQNPEIRRALNFGVDRNALVDRAFRGHGMAASGPVWPLHWAYDSAGPTYSYNAERAAASLDRALGGHKLESQRPTLKFTCIIPENFQLWERLALIVQRDLAEIGVHMHLQAVPFPEFNQRISQRNFDAVLMEMVSGFSVSRAFAFWHSTGLHSFSGYRNSSVDAALQDVKQAPNDADFQEAVRRFQQAMFEDPPAIFLAWGESARAVSRRFDVVKAPGGDIRMSIRDWKLAGEAAN
jgi:peptide/nickel transport system substrate-binding protein